VSPSKALSAHRLRKILLVNLIVDVLIMTLVSATGICVSWLIRGYRFSDFGLLLMASWEFSVLLVGVGVCVIASLLATYGAQSQAGIWKRSGKKTVEWILGLTLIIYAIITLCGEADSITTLEVALLISPTLAPMSYRYMGLEKIEP